MCPHSKVPSLLLLCWALLPSQPSADCIVVGAACESTGYETETPHRCGTTPGGGLTCSHGKWAACAGKNSSDPCDNWSDECCVGENCEKCAFNGGTCVISSQRVDWCKQCNPNDWYRPLCQYCDSAQMLCVNATRVNNGPTGPTGQQALILGLSLGFGIPCLCGLCVLVWFRQFVWQRRRREQQENGGCEQRSPTYLHGSSANPYGADGFQLGAGAYQPHSLGSYQPTSGSLPGHAGSQLPATSGGVGAGGFAQTVEQRLVQLEDLRTKGLVSRQEYEEKKKQILSDL